MGSTRKRHQHCNSYLNTVFIFDWDDTLLCTSFLSSMQFLEINNDARNLLKKLDETSSTLLSKVVPKGEIYIITNAAKGWVEYSSKLYWLYLSKGTFLKLMKLSSIHKLKYVQHDQCLANNTLGILADGKCRLLNIFWSMSTNTYIF